MKKLSLTLITALIVLFGSAQDSLVIPKNVVYKRASELENKTYREILTRELFPATVSYSLNPGILFIGPRLWKHYSQIPALASIKGGDMSIRMPITENGKVIRTDIVKGKVLQTESDFKLIWDQLVKDLSTDMKIRVPTSAELTYYWGIISFDILEPVYVVENASYKILFDSGGKKDKVMWIEQF